MDNERKNEIKIKIRKSNNLSELEKEVNRTLKKQADELYYYEDLKIDFQENSFLAILVLKTNNGVKHSANIRKRTIVRTLQKNNITELETEINALINETQNEKYYLLDLDIKKSNNSYIAIISFYFASVTTIL